MLYNVVVETPLSHSEYLRFYFEDAVQAIKKEIQNNKDKTTISVIPLTQELKNGDQWKAKETIKIE